MHTIRVGATHLLRPDQICGGSWCLWTKADRMFHPRKFLSLVLLSLLIWLPGCGSDSNDFTATSLGGGSGAVLPLSLEENLHTLAREIGGPGISTFSRADVRGKQVEESINGAKGGSITFSGDLNFGPDSSNPASSSLTAEFNNYTFFDGLTLNGGTGTLDTVLWGTEQSAQGSLILTAENVSFS